MAIYEVTIEGTLVEFEVDEDGDSFPVLTEETFSFVKDGHDLIEIMMAVQVELDLMNAALKAKYPDQLRDGMDWEFKIVGVCKTGLIHFSETWIKEYVQGGAINSFNKEES